WRGKVGRIPGEPSMSQICDRPVIGLFKTEVIRRRGPWRHAEAVEFAALEWGTGSTIGACSNPLAPSRPPKPKRVTMPKSPVRPWEPDPNKIASEKPGAVHRIVAAGPG